MAQWTNQKMARLRECYPVLSREELLAEFAPHTMHSLHKMASAMKLRRPRNDWKAIADAHVPVLTFGRSIGEVVE